MQSYITIKTIDGGFIFMEPDIFQKFLATKYGKKKVDDMKASVADDFFDKRKEKLVEWLGKEGVKEGLVLWIKQFRNLDAGRRQLLLTVQEKQGVDLENDEVMTAVLDLDGYLKENISGFGDLLYFDEKSGKFYWNK